MSSSSYASTSSTNASNMYASNAIAGNSYGSSSDCQNAATTAHLAGDLCRWGEVMMMRMGMTRMIMRMRMMRMRMRMIYDDYHNFTNYRSNAEVRK